MPQPPLPSVVGVVLVSAVVIGFAIDCRAKQVPEPKAVPLDVEFKLTDLDYAPLAGIPVRLVFGSDPDWQNPDAGLRFVTDANGAHRVATRVVVDKRLRQLPTNFVDSLLSRDQLTDHVMVGAELGYMTFHWLYTVNVYRFPGGDSALLDPSAVYTPDSQGRFVTKARMDAAGWHMPELAPMVLTGPGYEPWDFQLKDATADSPNWTLRLAFKRTPAPGGR